MACLALGVVASPPAGAIDIVLVWDDLDENPDFDPNGTALMAIAQAAAARWERLIPGDDVHIVDVSWSDLNDGQLGLWKFDPFGNNNVYFDSSSVTDWFIDASPSSDSEFDFGDPLDFDSGPGSYLAGEEPNPFYFESDRPDPPHMLEIAYFGNGITGSANEDFDLLSVVMHELGHELGVAGDELSGRYPLDADHVLGINGIEVIEGNCEGTGDDGFGYCEEHGHVAPPLALMSPITSSGVRTLPSAVDVLVAARDSNYEDVDLVRKFTGRSGSWSDETDWIGGRVPDASDDVVIAHGGTTTLTGERTADSVAIGHESTLAMTGDLTIDHELVIGSTGLVTVPFGAELIAETLEIQDFGDIEMTGGTVHVGGGTIASDGVISGRGRLETDGTLQVIGLVEAVNDLRLTGSGALRLIGTGDPDSGVLRALDGNIGLEIDIASNSSGRIEVGAGRTLTALTDVSIPDDVFVHLFETDPGEVATINSVGAGVDLTISNLGVGDFDTNLPDDGEILSRTVTFDDRVDIHGSLTLSSPVLTTLRGGLEVTGGFLSELVQNGDISVQGGEVEIDTDTFDWGNSTAAESHSIAIEPDASLLIRAGSLGSASNGFRGDIQVDSGVLDVNLDGFDTTWSLSPATGSTPGGTLGMSHHGAADPVVRGDAFSVNDFLIVSGGDAFIESDVTVNQTGKVVLFGIDARLFLSGHSTLNGGDYTGLGTLVQSGDIDVVRDTTIAVEEFHWGNSLGPDLNTLSIGTGDTLTIDSPSTGELDNPYRGHVLLEGGELVVNTDAGWSLPAGGFLTTAGSLELVNNGIVPRVAGQDLAVGGHVSVAGGTARIDSNAFFQDTSSTEIGAGATLQLTGANTYRGSFSGEGTLEHLGSALLGSTPLAVPHLVQGGRITALNLSGESLIDTETLRFDAGSETRLFGDLRIRGAATVEQDAEFNGSGSLIVDAGATLSGDAAIGVAVVNEGTVAPGNSPGRLDVLGDYAQTGKLEIELGGTEAGIEYDVLSILGDATLGGILELLLVDGFVPAPGDAFEFLLIGGQRAGTFDELALPDLGTNGFWDTSLLYTEGRATFVPEPGTALLLGLGLALLRSRRQSA